MLSNETEILLLKERVRIHELELQALCHVLLYDNAILYNKYSNRAKEFIDNDNLLKEIRKHLPE